MNLPNWLKKIKEQYNHPIITLFGNACDNYEGRQVTKEEAEKFAKENNLKYFEVSAKDNRNIKEGISEIVNYTYYKYETDNNFIIIEIKFQSI